MQEEKKEKLEQLFAEMRNADLPLRDQSPLVPGDGNPDAAVVFIGEAAGFHEARLQKPFVGQAGKLLDKLLVENRLVRSEVWITNVVKTRPPENRDPLPEEIEQYRPYLERELSIIQPKIIATLGRFAMNWFLEDEVISRAHGMLRKAKNGQLLFPLYHPAAALRNGNMLDALKKDFQKLVELINQDQKVDSGKDTDLGSEQPSVSQAKQKSLF